MVNWGGGFSELFMQELRWVFCVRIDIFDISIPIRPMTTKFSKQVHIEELTQKRLSRCWWCIMSRSCVKLKTYFHYQSACRLQTMKDDDILPMLFDPFITWSCKISTTMSMATKLDRMVTYQERVLHIKLPELLMTWTCKITWQTKNISTTRVPISTKLGSTITFLDRLRPTK